MSLFFKKSRSGSSQKESRLSVSRKYDLKPGRSYIVQESPPHMSFDAFVNIVSTHPVAGGAGKTAGLAVTRQHPDIVREKYGLEETPVYWLATRAGDKVISPTNLGILAHMLVKFAEDTSDGIILLDGIEYLVSNNDFTKVLRMVDQVNDHITQSGCRLILPVDPRAFDQKELALLMRNMDKLA
jgi:two-component system cell cycle response regulator